MDNLLPIANSLLAASSARWQILADMAAPELWSQRPAPAAWSAHECLHHLVEVEQLVFPVRLRAFRAGHDFPGFNPDKDSRPADPQQSPAALAAEFGRWRTNTLALLAELVPADLARTARHGDLGVVTLGEFLHEWVAHDLMHLAQAEQALMQPFVAASGPWRPSFAAYDLEAQTTVPE
jgi:hypothetical protein